MRNWLLPEHIADILPPFARVLEDKKNAVLELFRTHGYDFVAPPLMEYLDSLLITNDRALAQKTLRVDDRLSGRQLGLRADITPQVARIDAHLLSHRQGVTRLCYAGSVLHALPDGLLSSRQPMQIGAELYGFSGLAADLEIIQLMLATLKTVGVPKIVLTVGHMGVFYALADAAKLTQAQIDAILPLLQAKDLPSLNAEIAYLAPDFKQAFLHLPKLFGENALRRAREVLPQTEAMQSALDELQAVENALKAQEVKLDYDLTELRGTHYHTGLIFAAYAEGWSSELARGGRYDNVGETFGRARPATGFSLDMRHILRILPHPADCGICVAAADVEALQSEIANLRAAGEVVKIDYLAEGAAALGCDRYFERTSGGQFLLRKLAK